MNKVVSDRGFQRITCETYNPKTEEDKVLPLVSTSSAIGDYDDSMQKPGSSFLWIGGRHDHHLNREQVKRLVSHLDYWLLTGKLFREEAEKPAVQPDITQAGV